MNNWVDELLTLIIEPSPSEERISICLAEAVHTLGFRYYHLVYRKVLPLSQERVRWLSNYPLAWRKRYAQKNYFCIDPRIKLARSTEELIVWNDQLFVDTPQLWRECREHGLRHGVTQSVLNGAGGLGMLSLARRHPPISRAELKSNRQNIRTLTQLTLRILSRIYHNEATASLPPLSDREAEILRWSADGKSARDIAEILDISKNTVDFHIKNSVQKLQVPNKTAAVARAVLLGLLR